MSRCEKCNKKKCTCKRENSIKSYPSPNSPLSSKKLDELQECIEVANDLLRSLGNKPEPDNTRQLQLHLLELQGKFIHVTYLFGRIGESEETEELEENGVEESEEEEIEEQEEYSSGKLSGVIETAGRDFLQVNVLDKSIFVLYNRIISVALDDKNNCKTEKNSSMIDNKDKRELVLNFGEFVAKKFELVNVYFGIPLYKQLQEIKGKDVQITREDKQVFKGVLIEVEENRVTIENTRETIEIGFDEISLLEVTW